MPMHKNCWDARFKEGNSGRDVQIWEYVSALSPEQVCKIKPGSRTGGGGFHNNEFYQLVVCGVTWSWPPKRGVDGLYALLVRLDFTGPWKKPMSYNGIGRERDAQSSPALGNVKEVQPSAQRNVNQIDPVLGEQREGTEADVSD